MADVQRSVSKAFQAFIASAPHHANAWMTAVQAPGDSAEGFRRACCSSGREDAPTPADPQVTSVA